MRGARAVAPPSGHNLRANGAALLSVPAGGRLRSNLLEEGGVAPVQGAQATQSLGGLEERFAFSRAVSRLHEMQSQRYLLARRIAP